MPHSYLEMIIIILREEMTAMMIIIARYLEQFYCSNEKRIKRIYSSRETILILQSLEAVGMRGERVKYHGLFPLYC